MTHSQALSAAMPSQPGTVSPGGTLHPPPPSDSDAMEESEDVEPGAMHVAALCVNGMTFGVEQRTRVSRVVARLKVHGLGVVAASASCAFSLMPVSRR